MRGKETDLGLALATTGVFIGGLEILSDYPFPGETRLHAKQGIKRVDCQ
jgi:hypothetical protein